MNYPVTLIVRISMKLLIVIVVVNNQMIINLVKKSSLCNITTLNNGFKLLTSISLRSLEGVQSAEYRKRRNCQIEVIADQFKDIYGARFISTCEETGGRRRRQWEK